MRDLVTSIRLPNSASAYADQSRPTVDQLWAWLGEIPDPEVPAISIVELGIVRGVRWTEENASVAEITVTPTYTGCPATEVIAENIRTELSARGVPDVLVRTQLSPAWTTNWLTAAAKEKLRASGIAPPDMASTDVSNYGLARSLALLGRKDPSRPSCPRCGSAETELTSQFGSTPCKSLHRCLACFEPFDRFKCH